MANSWRCAGCGYRLEADAPPEECPGCGEKCDFIDDSRYVPASEGGPPGPDGPISADFQPMVVPEKCTGCRKCLPVCPAEAISMRGDVAWIDPKLCDGDGVCIPACPEAAIVLPEELKS